MKLGLAKSNGSWLKRIPKYVFDHKIDQLAHVKSTQGEIYMQFTDIKASKSALANLNGRWFGGHQISASYISDAIMRAHA